MSGGGGGGDIVDHRMSKAVFVFRPKNLHQPFTELNPDLVYVYMCICMMCSYPLRALMGQNPTYYVFQSLTLTTFRAAIVQYNLRKVRAVVRF